MACKKDHTETDKIIAGLPINQGGIGRHKCAACAYDAGVENGQNRNVGFDVNGFIEKLEPSQKGVRRHKDPLEAYSMGFFHGLSGINAHDVIQGKFELSSNMAQFGLMQVGKGLYECTFEEDTKFKHAMSMVHVASGFEIILKARIVQEHPYLIFEKLPRHAKVQDGIIKFDDLLEHGHTITYTELPERLWVTTACKIPNIDLYTRFGNVRNQIIHFATPNVDFSELVFEYCFKIIEPLINTWWDETLLEYAWEYDDSFPEYIFKKIEGYKLPVAYTYDTESNAFIKKG